MNDSTPIFINLSNHPSSGWSEEQLNAARAYGEIVDMPFPQVEPAATAADVHELAGELVAAILEYGEAADLTVHIMGEMTLCYAVISRLQASGIINYRALCDRGGRQESVRIPFRAIQGVLIIKI